jgi:hypothetical protein
MSCSGKVLVTLSALVPLKLMIGRFMMKTDAKQTN